MKNAKLKLVQDTHVHKVKDSLAWVAPRAGMILLTQSAYNGNPERERTIKVDLIEEIREDYKEEGGTWIYKTDGKWMHVDEEPIQVLEAMEQVYVERAKMLALEQAHIEQMRFVK